MFSTIPNNQSSFTPPRCSLKCPVCRNRWNPLSSETYITCPTCYCHFVQRPPTQKALQQASDYWSTHYLSIDIPYLISETDNQRLKRLSRHIRAKSSILDVGCGMGNFLRAARHGGYKVTGMDIASPIIEYLTKQHIPIVSSLRKLDAQTFDAAVSFDVIEHLKNPHAWLSNIHRALKANGILMISTPNAGGISARILGRHWWVFGPEDHMILYQVQTLKKLLAMHKFRILSLRTDTLTPWAYPPATLLRRLINKIAYVLFFPWFTPIYTRLMGDNIECLAVREK